MAWFITCCLHGVAAVAATAEVAKGVERKAPSSSSRPEKPIPHRQMVIANQRCPAQSDCSIDGARK